jgi:hypothetical protein
MDDDWSGADDPARKELDDTLASLLAEWPDVVPGAVTVAPPLGPSEGGTPSEGDADGTMGETDGRDNHIRNNPTFARDYTHWRTQMSDACKQGRLRHGLGGHPAAYTLIHEYGHVFANVALGRLDCDSDAGDAAIRQLVKEAWALVAPNEVSTHSMLETPAEVVPLVWDMTFWRPAVTDDLSLYATASPAELIAEGFAVHRVLGPGHSKIADLVARRLDEAYTKKFGPRRAAA